MTFNLEVKFLFPYDIIFLERTELHIARLTAIIESMKSEIHELRTNDVDILRSIATSAFIALVWEISSTVL